MLHPVESPCRKHPRPHQEQAQGARSDPARPWRNVRLYRRSAERVVQLWEYGKQSVPLERMRTVAAALGIPVDLLVP